MTRQAYIQVNKYWPAHKAMEESIRLLTGGLYDKALQAGYPDERHLDRRSIVTVHNASRMGHVRRFVSNSNYAGVAPAFRVSGLIKLMWVATIALLLSSAFASCTSNLSEKEISEINEALVGNLADTLKAQIDEGKELMFPKDIQTPDEMYYVLDQYYSYPRESFDESLVRRARLLSEDSSIDEDRLYSAGLLFCNASASNFFDAGDQMFEDVKSEAVNILRSKDPFGHAHQIVNKAADDLRNHFTGNTAWNNHTAWGEDKEITNVENFEDESPSADALLSMTLSKYIVRSIHNATATQKYNYDIKILAAWYVIYLLQERQEEIAKYCFDKKEDRYYIISTKGNHWWASRSDGSFILTPTYDDIKSTQFVVVK